MNSQHVIEIETRHCEACGKEFKCSTRSIQRFHSRECENSGKTWDQIKETKKQRDQLKRSQKISVVCEKPLKPKDRLGHFNAVTKSWPTPRRLQPPNYQIPKKPLGKDESDLKALKQKSLEKSAKKSENVVITPKIKKNTTPVEKPGMKKIGSEKMQPQELITKSIKSDLPKKSKNENISKIQPVDSWPPPGPLSVEISQAMNLLSDTAKHLYSSMKRLTKDSPDEEVRLLDVDRVRVTAECGKQIVAVMKTQLEVLKFAKECSK